MPSSPQSRYRGLPVVDVGGVPSLALRRPQTTAEEPDGLIHVLVGKETLDQLAKRYYGREDLWWRIADANPSRFPFEWTAGEALVIPPLRTAGRTESGGASPLASPAARRRRG
jgi:nucleoid-associated protein YgaU